MKHIIPAKPAYCAIAAAIAALTLLPTHAQASTAKEYALDYCKRNEATSLDYDPNSDGYNETDRWYGQERNRFMTWRDCVTTKTQEFAVAKDPAKAEYQPADKDRAYAQQYCGRKYENKTDGRVWYGGAAEAEDPGRTVSNSNFYTTQESCIEAKTAESYYGATVIGDAPYQKQSNEDLARQYCSEEKAVRHGKSITVYGVGVTSYDSQEACISDQKAHLDRYSEYVAKVKAAGGIMQPYDLAALQSVNTSTESPATSENPNAELEKYFGADAGNPVSDDCQIWLCLPAGFPSPQCDGAKIAFKKRMKKGRSPMPPFASCAVSADPSLTGITSANGNGKPPKFDYEMKRVSSYCDKSCRDGVGTERVIYRTQVTINGVPTGQATQEARDEAPRSWLDRAHDRERGNQ